MLLGISIYLLSNYWLYFVHYFAKIHIIYGVFENEASKICGRQPLKNFTWSILEYFVPYVLKERDFICVTHSSHFNLNLTLNLSLPEPISAQCCVSYRNQSFVLLCKTYD